MRSVVTGAEIAEKNLTYLAEEADKEESRIHQRRVPFLPSVTEKVKVEKEKGKENVAYEIPFFPHQHPINHLQEESKLNLNSVYTVGEYRPEETQIKETKWTFFPQEDLIAHHKVEKSDGKEKVFFGYPEPIVEVHQEIDRHSRHQAQAYLPFHHQQQDTGHQLYRYLLLELPYGQFDPI